MKFSSKWIKWVIGGLAALVLTGMAFTAWSLSVAADTLSPGNFGQGARVAMLQGGDFDWKDGFSGSEHFGRGGGKHKNLEFLAEALGISVEDLETAYQAVFEKSLEAAVEAGDLTEEQAESLLDGRGFGRFGGKQFGRHMSGAMSNKSEHQALLAEELGISVEELSTAQETAKAAALAQMIEDGRLTQEQADLMAAAEKMRDYLNREELMAAALGMSLEEFQAEKEAGTRMSELMEAQGLDAETMRDNVQAALEAALDQALADGVISAEEAELLQDKMNSFENFGRRGRGHKGGFGRGHHGGGNFDFHGPRMDGSRFQQDAPAFDSDSL